MLGEERGVDGDPYEVEQALILNRKPLRIGCRPMTRDEG